MPDHQAKLPLLPPFMVIVTVLSNWAQTKMQTPTLVLISAIIAPWAIGLESGRTFDDFVSKSWPLRHTDDYSTAGYHTLIRNTGVMGLPIGNWFFKRLESSSFSLILWLAVVGPFARKTGWEPSECAEINSQFTEMACPNSDTLSTQCSSLSRSTTWPSVAVFRHSSNVDEGRYDAPHRYNSFRIDYSLPGNVVTVKMLADTGCW